MSDSRNTDNTPAAIADDAPRSETPVADVAALVWDKVREHKVIQWGVAYLGAALALAHGAELIGRAFDWPEAVQRTLIGLLILGFPVAVTLAWYHGHKGLKRFAAGELMIIALLVLLGAGLLVVLVRTPEKSAAPPAEVEASSAPAAPALANSIAVLPFANMSGDAGQEYFCDGLAEEILNALVRLPKMKVIGRTSSFSFKGRNVDLRTIGKTLGATNILEGSVRRQGSEVRVSAQLVRASDGVELWSQSFDRDLSDILKVQEDIAGAIAMKLGGDGTGQSPAATTNGPAYDRYLVAKSFFQKGGYDGVERGVKALQDAVALDPNLAPAWAELARAYGFQYLYNKSISFAEAKARVAAARQRALELDPHSLTALIAIPGNNELNGNWAAREALLRRALAQGPNDISVLDGYARFLLGAGRFREAVLHARRVFEIDPLSPDAVASYGYDLYLAGARAEGKKLINQALALNPMNSYPKFLHEGILLSEGDLAAAVADQRFLLQHAAFDDDERAFGSRLMALALAGDKKALRDHVAAGMARARAGKLHTDWLDLDRWAMVAGDAELSAEAMAEEASRPNSRFSLLWRWSPLFAPARQQPAFKEILKRYKLPEFWRSNGWPDICSPVGSNDFTCL